jgi:hypothetical protein
MLESVHKMMLFFPHGQKHPPSYGFKYWIQAKPNQKQPTTTRKSYQGVFVSLSNKSPLDFSSTLENVYPSLPFYPFPGITP